MTYAPVASAALTVTSKEERKDELMVPPNVRVADCHLNGARKMLTPSDEKRSNCETGGATLPPLSLPLVSMPKSQPAMFTPPRNGSMEDASVAPVAMDEQMLVAVILTVFEVAVVGTGAWDEGVH